MERLDTFGAAEQLARMIEPGSLLEATPECLVVAAGDGATGSIGLSLFPRDAADAETLLKNADQAMYRAKRGGLQDHVSFAAP